MSDPVTGAPHLHHPESREENDYLKLLVRIVRQSMTALYVNFVQIHKHIKYL